jgi:hypothetical protein
VGRRRAGEQRVGAEIRRGDRVRLGHRRSREHDLAQVIAGDVADGELGEPDGVALPRLQLERVRRRLAIPARRGALERDDGIEQPVAVDVGEADVRERAAGGRHDLARVRERPRRPARPPCAAATGEHRVDRAVVIDVGPAHTPPRESLLRRQLRAAVELAREHRLRRRRVGERAAEDPAGALPDGRDPEQVPVVVPRRRRDRAVAGQRDRARRRCDVRDVDPLVATGRHRRSAVRVDAPERGEIRAPRVPRGRAARRVRVADVGLAVGRPVEERRLLVALDPEARRRWVLGDVAVDLARVGDARVVVAAVITAARRRSAPGRDHHDEGRREARQRPRSHPSTLPARQPIWISANTP